MAFKKLSELLNKTEEECKKQWNSLREQFIKNCTRHESSKKSGTGTDEVFTPSWKFLTECCLQEKAQKLMHPAVVYVTL